MITETIPDALDGQRVDRVVAMLASITRSESAALIDAGAVTLDGTVARAGSVRVKVGQELSFEPPDPAAVATIEPDPSIQFTVIYADDDVVVVDKPEGLVVHPGSGHDSGTLVHGLVARFPEIAEVGEPERPGIVHRLDKGTSGLLMVARTDAAYESLVDQLVDHSATRGYLALVWGHPTTTAGLVDAPIGRSRRDPTKMAIVADGKEARTRYEVLRTFDMPEHFALVRCELETGRTHQIRVHLSAIGHPVVGDPIYRGDRRAFRVARPLLHAAHLEFDHPITGERMGFDAPMAADMAAVLAQLS